MVSIQCRGTDVVGVDDLLSAFLLHTSNPRSVPIVRMDGLAYISICVCIMGTYNPLANH